MESTANILPRRVSRLTNAPPLVPASPLRRLRTATAWCSLSFTIALLIAPRLAAQSACGVSATTAAPATDRTPTLRRFPKELIRTLAALASRDNVAAVVIGAAATAGTVPLDRPTEDYFRRATRLPGAGSVGRQVGAARILGPTIGATFLASRMTHNARFRRFGYELAEGIVISSALTGGLKAATHRTRPNGEDRNSFPSGHASSSFMWATVIAREYRWRAGIPAYALAAYVAASRLQTQNHHLTDVMAGSAIGYIVGRTVTRQPSGLEGGRVRWSLAPIDGGGVALVVNVRP